LLEEGFLDDGAGDTGVFENVLAEVFVHFEDGVRGRGFGGGFGVGRRVGGAACGAFSFVFGHVGRVEVRFGDVDAGAAGCG
jgi:hypothetical protein